MPAPLLLAARRRSTSTLPNQTTKTPKVKKCADAGADIVRITVQGKREAEACLRIREQLFKDGYDTPLVADIHFQPAVAMMVAEAFEKVRAFLFVVLCCCVLFCLVLLSVARCALVERGFAAAAAALLWWRRRRGHGGRNCCCCRLGSLGWGRMSLTGKNSSVG